MVDNLCAITKVVLPCISLSIPSCTIFSVLVSIEDVASSSIIAGGLATAAPSQVAGIQNRLSQKVSPGATYYSENLQVSLSLIKAGYGTAVLPAVPSADTALTFVPLTGQAPLSYGIFYKKNARSHLKQVLSILKEAKHTCSEPHEMADC